MSDPWLWVCVWGGGQGELLAEWMSNALAHHSLRCAGHVVLWRRLRKARMLSVLSVRAPGTLLRSACAHASAASCQGMMLGCCKHPCRSPCCPPLLLPPPPPAACFLCPSCCCCRLVFSYEILTPAALNFFVSYAEGAVESLWSIDQYFQFVLVLMLSTGLSFQVGC